MDPTTVITAAHSQTFQGRYGYHNLSYADFMLLKAISKQWWVARRSYHNWLRWNRKQPQNRVFYKYLIDTYTGRKIGRVVVGPIAEPDVDYWYAELSAMPIEEVYKDARHPKATQEEVPALIIPVEWIRDVAREMGKRQEL